MADVAVEFLLQNLQQLLLYQADLIKDVKGDVVSLDSSLCFFKTFLDNFNKKQRKDQSIQELVREIKEVVYEAEDIIDTYVTQASLRSSRSILSRSIFSRPSTDRIGTIKSNAESIVHKVKHIYNKESLEGGGPKQYFKAPMLAKQEAPLVRQHNFVGRDYEVIRIIGYLNEETEQLDVISITGIPGLGKTTLAHRIFHDPRVEQKFPLRIWIDVSQVFVIQDVFLAILRSLTLVAEDINNKSAQELAQLVHDNLVNKRFLIVLDDVWTSQDLNELLIALPRRSETGKVLITSRHEQGCSNNNIRPPHYLRMFGQDGSWLLLHLEVFGESMCPPELEELGRIIANRCYGLPFAIVIMAGILREKNAEYSDMIAKKNAWTKVSKSMNLHYVDDDHSTIMHNIIELGYNKLPYHLRACFLYLGMFRENCVIPVWKLTLLWIAEGFIQGKVGTNLEKTAYGYLEDLIKRNLVKIDEVKLNGKVKTCRIHPTLLHFCRAEAQKEEENFVQDMKTSSLDVQKYRRLSIHSNYFKFISTIPNYSRLRSFLCFSKEEFTSPTDNISAIPPAFKLLRVLDVEPIIFPKIPNDMYHLVHLRYMVMSFSLSFLPAAFSNLSNIQTLIVDTTSPTLDVKADIWQMIQLRHLKTNASATLLRKTGESSKGGQKLQTLGTISPQSCTEEVFDRARNLKKLGIRGALTSLIDGQIGSFESLAKLDNLEKLKLINSLLERPLCGLPQPYKFPPNLKSLTLSGTCLDWSHMYIIGLLEKLTVLKLKNQAFVGEDWQTTDGGFRHLEALHIECANLINWEAKGHQFPRLRRLDLHNCVKLKEVPTGLADITSLSFLNLYNCQYAAASAERTQQEKEKKHAMESRNIVSLFKLTIYPSESLTGLLLAGTNASLSLRLLC